MSRSRIATPAGPDTTNGAAISRNPPNPATPTRLQDIVTALNDHRTQRSPIRCKNSRSLPPCTPGADAATHSCTPEHTQSQPTGSSSQPPCYDGAFVSGLYAHNAKTTENRQVAAAVPTWSTLNVATGDAGSETFGSRTSAGRISHYRQTVFMRCGLVRTSLSWTASDGRATDLATAWVPDAAQGTLTADLGRAVRLAKVSPEWTRTRPASHEVRTSLDGRHWHEGTTGPARYVRVTLRSADDKKRAGIEELRVSRAK
ncbi:hypothetical protein ACWGK6_08370 [Streptomyces violaceusniger]